MPLLRCEPEPECCRTRISFGTYPGKKDVPQRILSIRIARGGGFAAQAKCRLFVLIATSTVLTHPRKRKRGNRITLLSGNLIVPTGSSLVLRNVSAGFQPSSVVASSRLVPTVC